MLSKDGCSQNSHKKAVRAADVDVFHAEMVKDARFTGQYDLPAIEASDLWPEDIISFPEAMAKDCQDFKKTVHFFCDDFRFERFWNDPGKYLPKLKKFNGAIGTDFSTYPIFPEAVKIHNSYRNAACTHLMQREGIDIIANVRCEVDTADWALSCMPFNGVIAIGSHGCIKNVEDRKRFVASLKTVCDSLHPKGIVVVGSSAYGVFDYPKSLGIPVKVFPLGLGGRREGDAYEL